MRKFQETREICVQDTCQVLVAGGGFAGVSAALAAARGGKDVILLEREFMLGGLGTAGLVTIYLPICDGMGHVVSKGIAEELLLAPVPYGLEGREPKLWLTESTAQQRKSSQRYMTQYNPHICAMLMEQLLKKAGVRILYGTVVCAVEMDGDRIRSVIIENKTGRTAIEVNSVIDCTGDADVAVFAGAPTRLYPEKNPLAAWYYFQEQERIYLNQLGACDVNDDDPEVDYQRIRQEIRISGVDGWENSEFIQNAHEEIWKDMLKRRRQGDACIPTMLPVIPQLRMTRCIQGTESVVTGMDHSYVESSVGLFSNWIKRGPVYELPFGSLFADSVKNLLTAGRCLSTDDEMWNITRVIPVCAVSGQAAGTAAAVTDDFSKISISELQDRLRADGVYIHTSEMDLT